MGENKAYLSNEGQYTIFSFGETRLKFIAPYSLERYESVVQWDKGYLVVMAKYAHNNDLEEEYIDLIPILRSLYITPDEFLKPIKKSGGEICLIYKRSYREINKNQAFIKDNYQAMYDKWQEYSKTSFYIGK